MKTVRLYGGPYDGELRAVPDEDTHLTVYVIPGAALGFYGPTGTMPDGVWKWTGLYD
jgi:hypothetical protein